MSGIDVGETYLQEQPGRFSAPIHPRVLMRETKKGLLVVLTHGRSAGSSFSFLACSTGRCAAVLLSAIDDDEQVDGVDRLFDLQQSSRLRDRRAEVDMDDKQQDSDAPLGCRAGGNES